MNRSQKKQRLKKLRRNEKERKRERRDGATEGHAEAVDPAAVEEARGKLAEAEHTVRRARRISDERALEMLECAAELLDDIVQTTREALREVSPERKREAMAIIEALERRTGVSEPGNPQARPRRGTDPVVTIMQLGIRASRLLNRILKRTNPDVEKHARLAA